MLLENLNYLEVETYLEQKDIILVPVGSVEQHSAYGLIGTDFLAAEGIAGMVGKAMNILVAPTICYGISPHHMAFKGTVTLQTDTFVAVVADVVHSLVAHGFKRIVFINGHGGNVSAINLALAHVKTEQLPGMFQLISWYELDDVRKAVAEFFGDKEGSHATPSEVAVTRYLRPEEFSSKATAEKAVTHPKFYWPLSSREFRRVFPDGRIQSAPWMATADNGKKIAEIAAAALQKQLEESLALEIG